MSASDLHKWAGMLSSKYGISWPIDESDEE